MTLKDKAALALDLTHSIGERGPVTYKARATLACWLDGAIHLRASLARRYVALLLTVADQTAG